MDGILADLEKLKCWKSFMKSHCRKNKLTPQYSDYFTIVKIKKFYEKLHQNTQLFLSYCGRDAQSKYKIKSSVWLQNQLKAYYWVLIAVSGIKNILIQNFVRNLFINVQSTQEYEELSEVFNKQQCILEYEAIKLVNEKMSKKRRWDENETVLLMRIIQEYLQNNKWNEVARKLFQVSKKEYFRTGKQCRERWLNHLDPEKKQYDRFIMCSGSWTIEEDRAIVQYILKRGRKWSDMAKDLGGNRTEHMVKNRYKTLIIKMKKNNKKVKDQNKLLQIFVDSHLSSSDEEKQEIIEEIEENQNPKNKEVMKNKENEKQKKPFSKFLQDKILELQQQNDVIPLQIMQIEKHSNVRQVQIHQVVTPCPAMYSNFTPNYFNTPNSVPFFMNYSFGDLAKNQSQYYK